MRRRFQLFFLCLFVLASGSFLNGCPPDVSSGFELTDYFPLTANNHWTYALHEVKYAECDPESSAEGPVAFETLPVRLTIRVEDQVLEGDADYLGVPAWRIKKFFHESVFPPDPSEDEGEGFYFVLLGNTPDAAKQLPDRNDWGVLYEISEQDYLALTQEEMLKYDTMHLYSLKPPAIFRRWERWTMFDGFEPVSNLWWRFVSNEAMDPLSGDPALETWRNVPLQPLYDFINTTTLPEYGDQTLYDVLFKDANDNFVDVVRSDHSALGGLSYDVWNVLRQGVGPILFHLDISGLPVDEEKAWWNGVDCERRMAFASLIGMDLATPGSKPEAVLTHTPHPVTPDMRLAPRQVQFLNQSEPGGSRIFFTELDFDDGTSAQPDSTGVFEAKTYETPGLYNPQLTVKTFIGQDTAGLSAADYVDIGFGLVPFETVEEEIYAGAEVFSAYLEVTELPQASFVASNREEAPDRVDELVQFEDTSEPGNRGEDNVPRHPITGWEWDFDNDGVTDSTDQNPEWTFPGPGCYEVKLTVVTDVGPHSATESVEVTELPEASFDVVDRDSPDQRLGATVTFQDTSDPRNTGACGNYGISAWSWDFDGDGVEDSTEQSPTHTFPGPGCYPVTLTVTSGVGDDVSDVVNVEVTELPEASFEVAGRETAPDRLQATVAFTDTSDARNADACEQHPITSWSWDFDGDGHEDTTEQIPTFTYPGPGCYEVTLTVTSATGSDSFTDHIEVTELPVASFEIVGRTRAPDRLSPTASFLDTSVAGNAGECPGFEDYPIMEWAWDFDSNGTPDSFDRNPTWTFPGPGCYPVTLTVTTAAGADSSDTVNVEVTELPEASFEIVSRETPDVRLGPIVSFTTTSDAHNADACSAYPIAEWAWDFDNDGNADSNEQNPAWSFPGPGCYPVTLTVTSEVGQDTSDVIEVEVTELPEASVEIVGRETPEARLSATVDFADTSAARNGAACSDYPVTAWAWDFDNDGAADSIEQNPAWTFPGPGCYPVALTATSAVGSDTSDVVQVEVTELPVASFQVVNRSTPEALLNPEVSFLDRSDPRNVSACEQYPILAWAWDFDTDGTTDSTEQHPTWTFPAPGCYQVTLTVTSATGQDTSDPVQVEVTELPEASFVLVNRETPAQRVNPTVVFEDTSVAGAEGCAAYPVTAWAWDFNEDGITDSTVQNPTWTFPGPGCYPVTLAALGVGWDWSHAVVVEVASLPEASFETVGRTTPEEWRNPTVQFLDTSSTGATACGEYAITSWAWDFDSDSVPDSTEQNPTWTFAGPGCWPVTLTVTTEAGTDSSEIDVAVTDEDVALFFIYDRETPADRVSPTVTFVDASIAGNFRDCANYPITGWAWDFDGDGETDSTEQNPTWTYPGSGCYPVTLTVTSEADSDTSEVLYVEVLGPCNPMFTVVGRETPADRVSPTVTFLNTSTYGNEGACGTYAVTNEWDFDGDTVTDSTEVNPTWTFPGPGCYPVSLKTSTEFGFCQWSIAVEVTELPTANFEASPLSGAYPLTVNFSDLSSAGNAGACDAYPITGWAWDLDGDGATDSTDQWPTWEYSIAGSYDITLTVYTAVGEDSLTLEDYITILSPEP